PDVVARGRLASHAVPEVQAAFGEDDVLASVPVPVAALRREDERRAQDAVHDDGGLPSAAARDVVQLEAFEVRLDVARELLVQQLLLERDGGANDDHAAARV